MEDVQYGLDDLLDDSSTLIPNDVAQVHVHRNIFELEHAAARLAAKGSHGQGGLSETAAYFASRGYDLNKLGKSLKKLQVQPPRMQAETRISELDLETYLETQRNASIMESIRDSHIAIERKFRSQYDDFLQQEWNSTKTEILEHLESLNVDINTTSLFEERGKKRKTNTRKSIANYGMTYAQPAAKRKYRPSRTLETSRERYAEGVKRFAEAVLRRKPNYLPANSFKDIQNHIFSITVPESNAEDRFTLVWQTLSFLVGERVIDKNGRVDLDKSVQNVRNQYIPVKEQALTRLLIDRAKADLENQYADYIQSKTGSNRGGGPGLENDVQSYVQSQISNSNQYPENWDMASFGNYGTLPLWPVIYYCFRCGNVQGAFNAAKQGGEENFAQALAHIIETNDRRLPLPLWEELCKYYRLHVKTGCDDPFKIAMYCLVAKADPKHDGVNMRDAGINDTIEDYLWIRLNMLWEYEEEPPDFTPFGYSQAKQEIFSRAKLKELAETLYENKAALMEEEQNMPFYWTNILLEIQEFEECIKHLEKVGQREKAVHLGLVLNYYGLLYCEKLDTERSFVDLGDLVSKLVNEIARVDCDLAFHYLYVLHQSPTNASTQFEHVIIDNLANESCDYTAVVGTVNAREIFINGTMQDYFLPSEVYRLCFEAAEKANSAQRTSCNHAINLYCLAGAFGSCAEMLTRLLGVELEKPATHEKKLEYLQLAKSFYNSYPYFLSCHPNMSKQSIPEEAYVDLTTVINLATAFDTFREGPNFYAQVLALINQLGVLPPRTVYAETNQIERASRFESMKKCTEKLKRRHNCIKSAIPKVIDMIFDIYIHEAEQNSQAPRTPEIEDQLKHIRTYTDALRNFMADTSLNYGSERVTNDKINTLGRILQGC